jgi:hypothetical protein
MTQNLPAGQKPFFTFNASSDILVTASFPAATRRAFFEFQNSQNRVAKTFQYSLCFTRKNETKVKRSWPVSKPVLVNDLDFV